jgi:hypothetical protein
MRAAGKLAAQVLDFAGTLIKPGVTTEEVDRAVHKMIVDNGAYPSPLNYGKFPKSVCTSVNEVVCHGIPDDRPLQDGDILNVDVTVYLNGYHGDTSRMYHVGGCKDACAGGCAWAATCHVTSFRWLEPARRRGALRGILCQLLPGWMCLAWLSYQSRQLPGTCSNPSLFANSQRSSMCSRVCESQADVPVYLPVPGTAHACPAGGTAAC